MASTRILSSQPRSRPAARKRSDKARNAGVNEGRLLARGMPTHGLGKMLMQCHRAFGSELAARLSAWDLTVSQWAHLRTLLDEEGTSQVALSRLIGIEKASSTAVLDSLESRRLIRRVRDVGDRRRSQVYLTEAGLALVRSVVPEMLALNALGLRNLSRGEIAGFLKGLRMITENLRGASGRKR